MVQAQIVEELEEGHYIVSLEKPQIFSVLGAIPKSMGVGWGGVGEGGVGVGGVCVCVCVGGALDSWL